MNTCRQVSNVSKNDLCARSENALPKGHLLFLNTLFTLWRTATCLGITSVSQILGTNIALSQLNHRIDYHGWYFAFVKGILFMSDAFLISSDRESLLFCILIFMFLNAYKAINMADCIRIHRILAAYTHLPIMQASNTHDHIRHTYSLQCCYESSISIWLIDLVLYIWRMRILLSGIKIKGIINTTAVMSIHWIDHRSTTFRPYKWPIFCLQYFQKNILERKLFLSWLKFHHCVFPSYQLTIRHLWFRLWFGTQELTSH